MTASGGPPADRPAAPGRADGPVGGRAKADARLALGRSGEELAAAHLSGLGYRVLTRNYRCRLGEIDLVARDGETLVFVEVKTRRSRAFGTSAEAVSAAKQARLLRLADCYLQEHGFSNAPCRFDVVAVDAGYEPARVEVIRDAFTA